MIRWICVVLGLIGGTLTILLIIQEDEAVRKVTPIKENESKGSTNDSMYKGSMDSDIAETK